MKASEVLGKPGTYWDGKLVHEAYGSMINGLCFRRCENTGDPFQVKSPGQCVRNATPTCLRCIVWVQDD
jgi:hypothetical protein